MYDKIDDLTSEHINVCFDDWESYNILREANAKLFNSIPLDYVALINNPLINDQWY